MEKKSEIVLKDGKLVCKTTKLPSKWTTDKIAEILRDIIAWMNDPAEPHNLSVEEYLVKHDIYPNLIPNKIRAFERMNPLPDLTEIYRLYSMAKTIARIKLEKGGLLKKYDPTITKLCLSHHHGMRDHVEQGASSTYFFQQNVLNANVQGKSAAELAKRYQQIIRSAQGSQSIPLPGADEIQADIE